MTLRRAMEGREGLKRCEHARSMGLRVWAIERRDFGRNRPETALVFGRSQSDALRAAQAPARLGEPFADTTWQVAEVTSGWDEPVVWPIEAVAA